MDIAGPVLGIAAATELDIDVLAHTADTAAALAAASHKVAAHNPKAASQQASPPYSLSSVARAQYTVRCDPAQLVPWALPFVAALRVRSLLLLLLALSYFFVQGRKIAQ